MNLLLSENFKRPYFKKKTASSRKRFSVNKKLNNFSSPYAGITQIRFKGCNLRLKEPPPKNRDVFVK